MTLEAIVVDGVSKSFRIATEPTHSLKERLVRIGRASYEVFHALHDIDLTIDQGQTVGILGHNGSGKSTLLKCIAGILTPTRGRVLVRGRLASLLELGAGFHPDLTGRENVYINAAFYGMGRRDIDRVFDDIVDFAELAQFIDEPVKHYSSGMYVRLGFAVAVNLDPDVLLVDEVLAVGDEVFQVKCLSRIKEFQSEGRTIVFVTHAAETVRQVCDRAIVLDHGHLVEDAAPGPAIRIFREHLHGQLEPGRAPSRGQDAIGDVRVHHPHEHERRHLLPGESLTIEVDLRVEQPVARPVLDLEIGDRTGQPIFHVDSDALGQPLGRLDGARTIRIEIGGVWLLDGEFPVSLQLSDRTTGEVIDWRERVTTFEVADDGRADGTVALDVKIVE
ncbi:MAG: ABC transporter ATP-binding protein [Acidimicrobiia bacterium]|nr:ABC transporter ATP-binding protein [Acidimicrobiia bacterium]